MQMIRLALMWFFGIGIVANTIVLALIPVAFVLEIVSGGDGPVLTFGEAAFLGGLQLIAIGFFWNMRRITRDAYKRKQAQNLKRQESKLLLARMEARRKVTE